MWMSVQTGVKAVCFMAFWVTPWQALFGAEPEPVEVAPGVLRLGWIREFGVAECSGVVRSTIDSNVFWVHNDGRRSKLYGITRTGTKVAEFPVLGASLVDWEDLATDGRGHLFIADIGNNDADRREVAVYQAREPNPADRGQPVEIMQTWRLRYPESPFDSEALFIWEEHGYLISKVYNDANAGLYRFPLNAPSPVTLEFVTELDITTPVTGAAITPGGSRLGVVGQSGAFALKVKGDLHNAGNAKDDKIRFKDQRIEGCCFVEDGLLAISENRYIYLFTGKGFRSR
jgi:hypothetical protein